MADSPPDFEQIARDITSEAGVDAFDTTRDRRVTAFVISALRQVWNAGWSTAFAQIVSSQYKDALQNAPQDTAPDLVEQIAREIVDALSDSSINQRPHPSEVAWTVARLNEVWNARGAADAQAVEGLLKAAGDVVTHCPCDPDINPKWLSAWSALHHAIANTTAAIKE